MADHASVGYWIRRFLSEHLIHERGVSRNTQQSYRDTFCLFLPFVAEQRKTSVNKLQIDDLSVNIVSAFLLHLEQNRSCSTATRNQRLPALGAAKVLIATFTLIGGGVEPRLNLAANAFSRRRSPLAILVSARYGFSPGLLPKSASVRRSVVGEIEEMGSPLRGRVQDSTESSGFPSANAPLALQFLGSAGSARATAHDPSPRASST